MIIKLSSLNINNRFFYFYCGLNDAINENKNDVYVCVCTVKLNLFNFIFEEKRKFDLVASIYIFVAD